VGTAAPGCPPSAAGHQAPSEQPASTTVLVLRPALDRCLQRLRHFARDIILHHQDVV
jgi:hypothetical protein